MALVGMSGFWLRFPEVAARETRVIILLHPQGGLPPDRYGFLELYCDDPACDCRRVVLQVRAEDEPDNVLATINYGWERADFYAKRLGVDRELAREITEASLDPLNEQTELSGPLLGIFRTVVLRDTAYVQRLGRHYQMFKQQLTHPAGKPPNRRRAIRKNGQWIIDDAGGAEQD